MASLHGAEQRLITAIANDDVEEMQVIQESLAQSVIHSIGSSLHVAAMYSSVACARHLIAKGTDVNLCNKDGYSPMHLSSSDGDVEMIRLLIEARADLHVTTPDARARLMSGALALDAPGGRNALHLAAEKGRLAAVEVLYAECPVLADVADFDGALPRDVALREGAHAVSLAPNRTAIARLLGPDEGIPELASLRQLAQVDAKKRRQRLDVQEAAAKAAVKQSANGRPSDHGYHAKWPNLYTMQEQDIRMCLHPELLAALSSREKEQRHRALKSLCEEITPGVFAFQMVPEAPPSSLNQKLLEEIDNVEEWARQQSAWTLRRPNSMNRASVPQSQEVYHGFGPSGSRDNTSPTLPLTARTTICVGSQTLQLYA